MVGNTGGCLRRWIKDCPQASSIENIPLVLGTDNDGKILPAIGPLGGDGTAVNRQCEWRISLREQPSPDHPLISLVAPVYNEEAIVREFVTEVLQAHDAIQPPLAYEIVFVNDGSTDKSGELLDALATIRYPGNNFSCSSPGRG